MITDKIIEDFEETKTEFKILADKIQDFTTLLNKYNLEYKVEMWGSGGGFSIIIGKVSIDFYEFGRIEFNVNEEIEEKKDEL
jgi:hypothetical protein